ncbi:MAG: ATP-binding cassette domain-containing protein [Neisseriaceae bacterium]|jgi:ATPase subunit of ABC transporter with duplicated ATPase domains|nr:MAG: ATP-binding cassette domain-containing protein [Neisseriaceae bacterium]
MRAFLNKFLFRKNEEVYNNIGNLSGGEKARLSLASFALKSYDLLILDEITNNIDLITRNHIVSVLKEYAGALIVISHDKYFLDELGVNDYYRL